MIEISSIDPFSLSSLPLEDREKLPDVSAVYFALTEDKILYIGRADCLRKRWGGNSHHRISQLKSFPNVRIAWVNVPIEELALVEPTCIKYFSPLINETVVSEIFTGERKLRGNKNAAKGRYPRRVMSLSGPDYDIAMEILECQGITNPSGMEIIRTICQVIAIRKEYQWIKECEEMPLNDLREVVNVLANDKRHRQAQIVLEAREMV